MGVGKVRVVVDVEAEKTSRRSSRLVRNQSSLDLPEKIHRLCVVSYGRVAVAKTQRLVIIDEVVETIVIVVAETFYR